MRKLSSDEKIAWVRLSRKRHKKQLKRKKKPNLQFKKYITQKTGNCLTLFAPVSFELIKSKNRRTFIEFLDSLRDLVLVKRKPVRIDFTLTKNMVVCGTLLFYAELFHIKQELNSLNLISCTPPKDETVVQVLQHLGILRMLGCSIAIKPERADVINWKIATGDITDASEVGKILELQSKLPEIKSKKLYRGVSEAMTNVSQHAYLNLHNGSYHISENKGWWMFCREEDDHIFVAFCDLGIGIPKTLPKTIEANEEQGIFNNILQALFGEKRSKYSDGELIRAAIEVKRSRTKKRYRGKGLLDMIKAIETTGGKLAILSNKGGYIYTVNGEKPCEDIRNYKYPIPGTLILWSLPLNVETEVKT